MKKLYVTFSGSAYEATTKRIVEDAPKFGADEVRVYDDVWLRNHEFYRLNRWLFDLPGVRGLCWFAWKPLVILDALERFCDEGDICLFSDGDCYPIAPLDLLYRRCASDGGAMLFAAQGHTNEKWVKEDTWLTMAADAAIPGKRKVDRHSQHAVARFMLFQSGHWHVQQFLYEWLTYCLNPWATTFDPSVIEPDRPELVEPRTEQAILSLLAHKYGHHLYREACQFGNGALKDGEDAWYPQTFVQVHGAGPRNDQGSIYRNV